MTERLRAISQRINADRANIRHIESVLLESLIS